MTDEEWAKTQSWLKGGAKAAPPKPPPPPEKGAPSPSRDALGTAGELVGSTLATVGGIGKGLAQMGAPPGGVSLREADPKGPVATWAKSEDKDYPVAEKAGRLVPEYAGLALLPDIGTPEFMAKTVIPEFPRVARVIGKGLEGTWKGGVGGATQDDPQTGAAVGGGTAAGTAAFLALPHWAKTLGGLAAIEGARELKGGGRLPWGAWHMAHPLALMAAAVLGKFPGLSGAIGAKLGQDDEQ